MERFTVSLDDALARQFDDLIQKRGYENRSEAFRDLLRRELEERRVENREAPECVANLSYVYDFHHRQLATRLTAKHHGEHDLSVATTHIHLDHDNCLESVLLRGPTRKVTRFADAVIAESGVRHGQLNLIPVDLERPTKHHHGHVHLRPKS